MPTERPTTGPTARVRRRVPHPDAAPHLGWGITAVICFLVMVGCFFYGSRMGSEAERVQARIEAEGIQTPAVVTGRRETGDGFNAFQVQYTVDGVTRTGVVYTLGEPKGTNVLILVSPDDPDVIGVHAGSQATSWAVTRQLALVILVCLLTIVVCLAMFWIKSNRPRRARRRRSTASDDLPQVFEATVVSRRREGAPTDRPLRDPRAEIVVTKHTLQYRSLRWRIDPVQIPWTDITRIDLSRGRRSSDGGRIEATGWAELRVIPTARDRYLSALSQAGLVVHQAPWDHDVMEATRSDVPPSWAEDTVQRRGDGQAPLDTGR